MAAFEETRGGVTIPWRQTPPASLEESAGTAGCPFTSIALPIDCLNGLKTTRPATYAKFKHFKELWTGDRVTREDFHALVELMQRSGSKARPSDFCVPICW